MPHGGDGARLRHRPPVRGGETNMGFVACPYFAMRRNPEWPDFCVSWPTLRKRGQRSSRIRQTEQIRLNPRSIRSARNLNRLLCIWRERHRRDSRLSRQCERRRAVDLHHSNRHRQVVQDDAAHDDARRPRSDAQRQPRVGRLSEAHATARRRRKKLTSL